MHSIADANGPVFVSMPADKCFGYTFGATAADGKSVASATALGKTMILQDCGPRVIGFVNTARHNSPHPFFIVLTQDRSKIIAGQWALEHAIAKAIGPIFVSALDEKWKMGYTLGAKGD